MATTNNVATGTDNDETPTRRGIHILRHQGAMRLATVLSTATAGELNDLADTIRAIAADRLARAGA